MDQQELQNTIAKYYQKLPPRLQGVFSSMNWLEILKGIKEKNGLNETQTETLSIETTLLLLAIINNEEYEAVLRKDLGLEPMKIDLILKEINAFILNTIQLELRQTFENNQDELLIGAQVPEIENQKEDSNTENISNNLNYQERVYQIGKENNLTVAQITKLAEIVGDVLSGKIFGDQFLDALSVLGIDEEKKKKIAEDINNKIFLQIRNKMMGKEEIEIKEVVKPKVENEPEIKTGTTNEEKKDIEINKVSNSIFAQKLTSQTKSNIEESNHSASNINPIPAKAEIKKIDPYREVPE